MKFFKNICITLVYIQNFKNIFSLLLQYYSIIMAYVIFSPFKTMLCNIILLELKLSTYVCNTHTQTYTHTYTHTHSCNLFHIFRASQKFPFFLGVKIIRPLQCYVSYRVKGLGQNLNLLSFV